MGLLGAMAANRMQTRQSYRTMARMQRRRSYVQERMGMRQDFEPAGATQQPPLEEAPAPDYTAELERLAALRDKGVISAEDFDAKKKQLLGI